MHIYEALRIYWDLSFPFYMLWSHLSLISQTPCELSTAIIPILLGRKLV